MQRWGKNRSIADSLKSETLIMADGETDSAVSGNRDPSVDAGGITIDQVAVTDDVHREDPVFIKTPRLAQFDDRLRRHREDVAKILPHIDEGNVAQVLAVVRIEGPSGKIDPREVIEKNHLRRLGELPAVIGQAEFGGIEDFPELPPFQHSRGHAACLRVGALPLGAPGNVGSSVGCLSLNILRAHLECFHRLLFAPALPHRAQGPLKSSGNQVRLAHRGVTQAIAQRRAKAGEGRNIVGP
jgi:hypothetical protein